ncbi:MAG: aspartate/glutamate racemase family protein [Clostridia bacterium]|nr:aspartate/glutamate racemase family protein [Clostridia bacterium]
MKIKIINPNTTWDMTESIRKMAESVCDPGTEIIAVSPTIGPASIEGYVDEYMSAIGVVDEVIKGEKEGCDAYIIACFGDPGLEAAREATDKPVLGIAESAMTVAKVIAPYFSVLSVLDRSRKMTDDLVIAYGCRDYCRSVRSTGLEVLEFGRNPEKGLAALIEQGKKAVNEDGAECILLGCAGFVDFVEALNKELGVPVLDGVSPAVKLAEAYVKLGIKTSKVNTYKYPEKKEVLGFERIKEGLYL